MLATRQPDVVPDFGLQAYNVLDKAGDTMYSVPMGRALKDGGGAAAKYGSPAAMRDSSAGPDYALASPAPDSAMASPDYAIASSLEESFDTGC